MLQPLQHDLSTSLLNLTSKEDFIQNSIDLYHKSATCTSTMTLPLSLSLSTPSSILHPLPFSFSAPIQLTATYLIKPKNNIKLTNVPKKTIQHLDKKMHSLQISKLVVVVVDAYAEEQPSVPPVYDSCCAPEFYKVGLVSAVSGRDQAVDLWCVRVEVVVLVLDVCWCDGVEVWW